MIRFAAIVSAALAGWIVVTLLMIPIDPWLAGHGMEPLSNRVFLDKETLGIHLNGADGVAMGAGLLAAIFVALRPGKGRNSRRQR